MAKNKKSKKETKAIKDLAKNVGKLIPLLKDVKKSSFNNSGPNQSTETL